MAELPTGRGDGVPSGYQVDVVCGVGELKLRLLDSSTTQDSQEKLSLYCRYWLNL